MNKKKKKVKDPHLLIEEVERAGRLVEQFSDGQMILKDFEAFGSSAQSLIATLYETYKGARIIGSLIILAGVATIAITFIATMPLVSASPHEVIALGSLAALLVVSGCSLYAFLANLEYKRFVASQDMVLRNTEIIEKNQELKLRALEELTEGLTRTAEALMGETEQVEVPDEGEGWVERAGG